MLQKRKEGRFRGFGNRALQALVFRVEFRARTAKPHRKRIADVDRQRIVKRGNDRGVRVGKHMFLFRVKARDAEVRAVHEKTEHHEAFDLRERFLKDGAGDRVFVKTVDEKTGRAVFVRHVLMPGKGDRYARREFLRAVGARVREKLHGQFIPHEVVDEGAVRRQDGLKRDKRPLKRLLQFERF